MSSQNGFDYGENNVKHISKSEWIQDVDALGKKYYINKVNGHTTYEIPASSSSNELKPNVNKKPLLLDPGQWDEVIAFMASTMHPDQQIKIFNKLRKIAEKMIMKDDPKYRQLYLNNPKLQSTVLAFDGGLEFLFNLGFEHDSSEDKLVCKRVNYKVVNACLVCLETKIESLTDNLDDDYDKNAIKIAKLKSLQDYNNNYNNNSNNNNNDSNNININITDELNSSKYFFSDDVTQSLPPKLHNNKLISQNSNNRPPLIPDGLRSFLNQSPPMKPKKADNNPNSVVMNNLQHLGLGYTPLTKSKSDPLAHSNDIDNSKVDVMIKTIILLRHGNSEWNKYKNSGQKYRAVGKSVKELALLKIGVKKHEDSVVIDAPLSTIGINEAYNLSKYLQKHYNNRQFKLTDGLQHHQKLSEPIKDAYRIMQQNVLDKYEKKLRMISKTLLNDCKEVCNILENAQRELSKIMLKLDVKQQQYNTAGGIVIQNNNNDNSNDNNNDNIHVPFNKQVKLNRAFSHVVVDDDINGDNKNNDNNEYNDINDELNNENILDPLSVLDLIVDVEPTSIIVTSNLRRAISTAIIALWDRLSLTQEYIQVLPCLQEIGMNLDTHTPLVNSVPQLSTQEQKSSKLNSKKLMNFYQTRLIVNSAMAGKKNLSENNDDQKKRLYQFCDWVFNPKQITTNGDIIKTIITVGHSHWFRLFFKEFLPKNSNNRAKKTKLKNCAIVAFNLKQIIKNKTQISYEIIEDTITPVYRGFH